MIDLCIETKLRILNGRVDGDSLGYNTYYSPRGSSNLGYFLASEDIFHDFIFVHVFQPNELSDIVFIGLGCKIFVIIALIMKIQSVTMKFYQVNLVWKQAREKILLQALKK